MADRAGEIVPDGAVFGSGTQQTPDHAGGFVGIAGTTTYFKMIAEDASVDGLVDTWKVTGSPDFTGASYSGGVIASPFRAVSIAGSWTV